MTTDVASPPDIHSAAADTLVLALIREEDSTVESENNGVRRVLKVALHLRIYIWVLPASRGDYVPPFLPTAPQQLVSVRGFCMQHLVYRCWGIEDEERGNGQ